MDDKPIVLVLMGGPDAEREVSLQSGREVAAALRQSKRFNVIEQVINRPTVEELRAMGGDVAFPVLHGQWGEGGPLQELLEAIGLPYVGSGPEASARAMDKLITKEFLAADGIKMLPSCEVQPHEKCPINLPLVLKPVDDGSSVDLRICRTGNELEAARNELHTKRTRLMAESYIPGREVTVGIVCNEPLPLIEIVPAAEFYDYEAKYTRDDTQYVLDPDLPPGVADQCRDISMRAYNLLGCRDIARVDFMLDERGPWFLELNTMPGFTTHSLVPMAARKIGLDMSALCSKLVEAALSRQSVVSSA